MLCTGHKPGLLVLTTRFTLEDLRGIWEGGGAGPWPDQREEPGLKGVEPAGLEVPAGMLGGVS